MVGWQGVHFFGTAPKIVYCIGVKQTKEQMNYTVYCPKLDEREVCYSQEHAIDVAYSMHNESDSYVWVEDYLGHTVIELGDIVEGISQLVFS